MKTLTLCTHEYRQALEGYLSALVGKDALDGFTKASTAKEPIPFAAQCAHDAMDVDALAQLLEHIAILRHPVYRHSPKLTDIALELRHTKIHETNVKQLTQYLHENDKLHLEGYTTFRMADFSHELDMRLYSIIKRMRGCQSPE